jgi:hypothetical protein
MSEQAPHNHEPDIFARLTGMSELSLGVMADKDLNAVIIDVSGLPGTWQAVLARNSALDLANRILHAAIALKPPAPPVGPRLLG